VINKTSWPLVKPVSPLKVTSLTFLQNVLIEPSLTMTRFPSFVVTSKPFFVKVPCTNNNPRGQFDKITLRRARQCEYLKTHHKHDASSTLANIDKSTRSGQRVGAQTGNIYIARNGGYFTHSQEANRQTTSVVKVKHLVNFKQTVVPRRGPKIVSRSTNSANNTSLCILLWLSLLLLSLT